MEKPQILHRLFCSSGGGLEAVGQAGSLRGRLAVARTARWSLGPVIAQTRAFFSPRPSRFRCAAHPYLPAGRPFPRRPPGKDTAHAGHAAMEMGTLTGVGYPVPTSEKCIALVHGCAVLQGRLNSSTPTACIEAPATGSLGCRLYGYLASCLPA